MSGSGPVGGTASATGLRVAGSVRRGTFGLDLDLTVGPGETVVLLGPNGAGKSTLLLALAGLVPLSAGRLELGGAVLDDVQADWFVRPAARNVGLVFQDHRLFPRLTVRDNVAFGPRARGVAAAEARRQAQRWLDRLDVGALADRRPGQLSGGQAQRVALARALVTTPAVLLLDEPLSALDAQTRGDVQGALLAELARFAGPAVVVTHDPVEAVLLADRIVVLEDGRVVQQGPPAQVLGRPATPYVARLVGVNLLAGTAAGDHVRLAGGGRVVCAPEPAGGPVLVAIRPAAITLHTQPPEHGSARNVWPGRLVSLRPLADSVRAVVDAAPPPSSATVPLAVDLTAAAVAELGLVPGRAVWLALKATELSVYGG